MAFITDSVRAQNAFNTALDQAKTTTRDLFSSFGLTKQDPQTGSWSSSIPGQEYAPSNMVSFNQETGTATINQTALDAARSGEFGTSFGYNRMSQAMGQGASREAAAVADVRGRGLGGGGLGRQARAAAESQQAVEQTGVVSDLLSSLGQTYAGTAEKFGDWMGSRVEGAGAVGQSVAETNASNPYSAPAAAPVAPVAETGGYSKIGTPGGNAPRQPKGGQLYTGPGGVSWQYRINGPSGKGWYKK